MQAINIETEFRSDPTRQPAYTSYRVHLFCWEEKIIAAIAKDGRLQALLERSDNFYERITALCIHKSVHISGEERRKLGKALVKAGNFGLGKRHITSVSGFSYIESQKLLNKYYEIFYPVKRWLNSLGRETAKSYVSKIINGLVESSLENCLKKIPHDWFYVPVLTFHAPLHMYDLQIEKFLKHFFERELEIDGTMISLPISISRVY